MQTACEKAFAAVRAGDIPSLMELLASDRSLAGARDASGLSLVLLACYYRKKDMLDLLVEADPPLGICEAAAVPDKASHGRKLLENDRGLAASWSPDGFTPLHLAAYFGNEEMVALLLVHHADVNAVSRNPMCLQPLHSACAGRALGIVQMLLEQGADVNARQHGGWTPLHSAVNNGAIPIIELLLSYGADPSLASDDGKSSFDLAAEPGRAAVQEALRTKRAG
jgi:ankyrin repeat protein